MMDWQLLFSLCVGGMAGLSWAGITVWLGTWVCGIPLRFTHTMAPSASANACVWCYLLLFLCHAVVAVLDHVFHAHKGLMQWAVGAPSEGGTRKVQTSLNPSGAPAPVLPLDTLRSKRQQLRARLVGGTPSATRTVEPLTSSVVHREKYQWYYAVHHVYWLVTHTAFATLGTLHMVQAVFCSSTRGAAAPTLHHLLPRALCFSAAPTLPTASQWSLYHFTVAMTPSVAVGAVIWGLGFAHIFRHGVTVPDVSRRRGLFRLTDSPIFALLIVGCAVEVCTTPVERTDGSVIRSVCALVLVWVIIGGTHQNFRLQPKRQWLVCDGWTPAGMTSALSEIFASGHSAPLVGAWLGVTLYIVGGVTCILMLGQIINIATAWAVHVMGLVAAVRHVRYSAPSQSE